MKRAGAWAEEVAADYLEQSGCEILFRNLRLGYLEVDLVARQGTTAILVEVKARRERSLVRPFAAVTATKRTRMRFAADRLWARHFRYDSRIERLRFDVIAVYERAEGIALEHAEGVLLG